MIEFLLHLQKAMGPYVRALEAFSRKIEPMVLALQKLERTWRPHIVKFLDGLRRFEDFNRRLSEQHQTEMLALPPFFNEYSLSEIVQLFEDPQKQAICVYDDFFSNRENIAALLSSWSDHALYRDRIPILRDALDAHLEGDYTLSIPALLTQIEGIVCEIFGVSGHSKAKGKLSKLCAKAPSEACDSALFPTESFIAQILNQQVFLSTNSDAPNALYPNRHRIQHGVNTTYYKIPYASLRCILLLDFLRSDDFLAASGMALSNCAQRFAEQGL